MDTGLRFYLHRCRLHCFIRQLWLVPAIAAVVGCVEVPPHGFTIARQLEEIRNGKSNELDLYSTRDTDEILGDINGLKGVRRVSFSECSVTVEGVKSLTTLPDLTEVTFYQQPKVPNEWVKQLRSAPCLQELTLGWLGAYPDVQVILQLPHLRVLKMDCPVGPELLQLAQATELERLTLVGRLSDQELDELRQKLPSCEVSVVPNWK